MVSTKVLNYIVASYMTENQKPITSHPHVIVGANKERRNLGDIKNVVAAILGVGFLNLETTISYGF